MSDTAYFPATDDPNLRGKFVSEEYIDPAESKRLNKPVTKTRTILLIRAVGGHDTVARKVRPNAEGEELIRRFPEAWAAFEGKQVNVQHGTPLEDLPGMTSERAAMLRNAGVSSIEYAAEMDESVINRLGMGARDLVRTAQMFVKARDADERAAEQPKRRRGRPPKVNLSETAE